MRFGLPQTVLEQIQGCLKRYPHIRWVKIYGSRAVGHFRPGSDIDLAFDAPTDCSLSLSADLAELPIPYRCDVTYYPTLQNVDLKTHIETQGLLIFP